MVLRRRGLVAAGAIPRATAGHGLVQGASDGRATGQLRDRRLVHCQSQSPSAHPAASTRHRCSGPRDSGRESAFRRTSRRSATTRPSGRPWPAAMPVRPSGPSHRNSDPRSLPQSAARPVRRRRQGAYGCRRHTRGGSGRSGNPRPDFARGGSPDSEHSARSGMARSRWCAGETRGCRAACRGTRRAPARRMAAPRRFRKSDARVQSRKTTVKSSTARTPSRSCVVTKSRMAATVPGYVREPVAVVRHPGNGARVVHWRADRTDRDCRTT